MRLLFCRTATTGCRTAEEEDTELRTVGGTATGGLRLVADAGALLWTGTASVAREASLRPGSSAAGRDGARMTRRWQWGTRPHAGARYALPRPCEQSYGGIPADTPLTILDGRESALPA